MKSTARAAVLALGLGAGCAPIEIPPPPSRSHEAALAEAERKIARGEIASARAALRALKQRERSHPDRAAIFASADRLLARAAFRSGDFAAADRALAEWLQIYPTDPHREEVLLLRADALINLDRPEAARAIQQTLAASNDPDMARLGAILCADAAIRGGRSVEAVDWLLAALEKTGPAGEEAAWLRERVLAIIGRDFTSAQLEAVDRWDTGGFPTGEVRLELAARLTEEERYPEAQLMLERFLSLNGDHPEAAQAARLRDSLAQAEPLHPYTFGALLPLSGDYAVLGEQVVRTLEMALGWDTEWARRARPQLVVRDTGGDPVRAAGQLEELFAQQRVMAVFGPLLTEEAQACAPKAEALGLPLFLFSAQEGLAEIGPHVFQFSMNRADQAHALAEYAVKEQGRRRLAIFHPDNAVGEEFLHLFWDAVEQVSVEGDRPRIVAVERFDPALHDFQEPIRRLVGMDAFSLDDRILRWHLEQQRRLQPGDFPGGETDETLDASDRSQPPDPQKLGPEVDFDALFLPSYYDTAGLLIPQLAYYDVYGSVLRLGTSGWNHPKLVELAGDAAEGVVFVDGYWSQSERWANRAFVGAYREVFGESPGLLEAQAFDAMGLVLSVLKGLDDPSRDRLAETLAGVKDWPGVTGAVSIDPEGRFHRPLLRLTVQRGNIMPPPEAAPPTP